MYCMKPTITAAAMGTFAALVLWISLSSSVIAADGENPAGDVPASDGLSNAQGDKVAAVSMVKDISEDLDTPPMNLAEVGGDLFFLAGADFTYQLWRSDGTPEGTVPVAESPSFDCLEGWCDYGFELVESGGLAHLAPRGGSGIWRTDGSAAGTTRVTRARAGFLTDVDGVLYFVAGAPPEGYELWRSDGTADGTTMVRDIASGRASGTCPSTGGDFCTDDVYAMGHLRGRIFFGADDGRGEDLWVSDGTARGTKPLKDIRADRRTRGFTEFPAWFHDLGGQLFFSMDDGLHGYELWVTDGSRRGTRIVRDIRSGPRGSMRVWDGALGDIDGEVYFVANDGEHGQELWASDGTRNGTRMVRDLRPGSRGLGWVTAADVGDKLLFTADDGDHGSEIWITDGTATDTHLVRDIAPGQQGSEPEWLTSFGDEVIFVANDAIHGRELWRTDGTHEGSELVADIGGLVSTPCPPDSWVCDEDADPGPAQLTVVGDTAYFTADDGVHGRELWRYGPG